MNMPRYLVAYYSWTGNTAKIAQQIALNLSADIMQIKELKPRGGFLAFPDAIIASLLHRSPRLQKLTKNLTDYDVVIMGGPVWASNMATPMRSFILQEKSKFKDVAFFCTQGGSGGRTALAKMASLSGHGSKADLLINRPEMLSDRWNGLVRQFTQQLQTTPNFIKPKTLAEHATA